MTQKSFTIEYQVHMTDNRFETHTTRVKNCFTELHANSKLEDYLKRKYPMFKRLVVLSVKGNIGGMFDFMGEDNPFR